MAAKRSLHREPVEWSGKQAVAIVRGFDEVRQHWGLRLFACSVLPSHVHLVVGRVDRDIVQVMNQMKGRASRELVRREIHPFQDEFETDGKRATCWTERGWKVFLDGWEDVGRSIAYVEENPVKEGKGRQRWAMVERFDANVMCALSRERAAPRARG